MEKINLLLEQYKLPLALSLVGVVLIIGGIVVSSPHKSKAESFPKESLVNTDREISIDVSGAVIKPGVYKLKEGLRVEDAIKMAGGFAETASKDYIAKNLNLAQKLLDGTKVYVPLEGENIPLSQAGQASLGITTAQININTGSASDLEGLSGVGAATAAKIISNRPYQATEDLVNKKVIGKSLFEKIKAQLVVY